EEADEAERADDPEIAAVVLELQGREAPVARDQKPHAAAGEADGDGKDAQHLAEGEGDEREIGAAQAIAEARQADDEGNEGGKQTAGDQADPRIDAELDLQHRDRIGARAEEGRVAEGELAAIAAQNVPGLAEEGNV